MGCFAEEITVILGRRSRRTENISKKISIRFSENELERQREIDYAIKMFIYHDDKGKTVAFIHKGRTLMQQPPLSMKAHSRL